MKAVLNHDLRFIYDRVRSDGKEKACFMSLNGGYAFRVKFSLRRELFHRWRSFPLRISF